MILYSAYYSSPDRGQECCGGEGLLSPDATGKGRLTKNYDNRARAETCS